ncbi:MAG: hypothetical protein QXK12_04655 [Candidatus Nezhaarchaeales archaeon]
MLKVVKASSIILVSADWEKTSSLARRVCEEAAKNLGLPLEERKEDWTFLAKYGAKDEYGGVDIPQVFVKYEDGTVKQVFSRIPLNKAGKPDLVEAIRLLNEAVGKG